MFTSFVTIKTWYTERNKFILTSSALNHTRTECKNCVKNCEIVVSSVPIQYTDPAVRLSFSTGFHFRCFSAALKVCTRKNKPQKGLKPKGLSKCYNTVCVVVNATLSHRLLINWQLNSTFFIERSVLLSKFFGPSDPVPFP